MARYDVAPTRTNLMRLKGDLSLVHEGHELLEQKRQILILELKQLTTHAKEVQRRADEELARAYAALQEAQAASGITGVYSAACAVNITPELTLKERRVMGVGIPTQEFSFTERTPHYGAPISSVWTDEASDRFRNALRTLAELAEARIAVVRLARAIQKTIRRVNALEKILIPDYEESVKYIQDSLEESDRQGLFTLKLVKERLEQRNAE